MTSERLEAWFAGPGIPAFAVARLPRIDFGRGRIEGLAEAVGRHGQVALVVTGQRSFRASERREAIVASLAARSIRVESAVVAGEPSPGVVDDIVRAARSRGVDVVVGIGGGSVLDAAKAVAGLIATGTSARDHLEGIPPQLPYPGPATPFIAVPTTAGTGSEATRNAVLSERGPDGFKRSFRDDRLVAVEAIVDPDLLAGASPGLIAANGMDALTQLLESYVSLRASPFTDALALSGLMAANGALLAWHRAATRGRPAATTAAVRDRMAYAALLSGICLAQAGLGVAHGLASPLGAYFPIPHGAACAAVLPAGVDATIRALSARSPESPALARFAVLGRLLGEVSPDTPDADARDALVRVIRAWTEALGIPGLAAFGVTAGDIPRVVAGSRGSSMRTNPVALTDDEVAAVVRASL